MSENNDYQKISRKDFCIVINNKKIKTPDYTHKATSRYRFNSDFILQKQCAKCLKWFDIAKYDLQMESWTEIWQENEYRKLKSGFYSYCTTCTKARNTAEAVKPSNTSIGKRKDTVIWDSDIYDYIQLACIVNKKSKNKYLNDLLRGVVKDNPYRIIKDKK